MSDYIIYWHDSFKNSGGSKAKGDVVSFLEKKGDKVVDIPQNKLLKVLYVVFILPFLVSKIKTTIILQFPMGPFLIRKLMILYIKKFSKAKLIILVHDLETIRNFDVKEDKKLKKLELSQLKSADGLIVLNTFMEAWLNKNGITIPMSCMVIWDYYNTVPLVKQNKLNYSVCFVGNLTKSKFLGNYNIKKNIYAIGSKGISKLSKNIIYKGEYSPEEIPKHLNYNFGLVWDGDNTNTCSGKCGFYLMYNAPHKLSLYISSGIPVIIWSKAASASIVKKYNLGILIDNLDELEHLNEIVNELEYKKMIQNVRLFSKKLRRGEFLKDAVLKIKEKISV